MAYTTSGRAVEHRALDRHPVETFGVVTLENVERVAPLKANPTSSDPVLRPHPDLGEREVTSEMSVRGVGLSQGS